MAGKTLGGLGGLWVDWEGTEEDWEDIGED